MKSIAICGLGFACAIGAAAAQPAPGPSTAFPRIGPTVPGGPPAGPLPGDHYLCYMVNKKITPLAVSLKDQFGGYDARVIAITRLCNPVQKNFQGRSYPIQNPQLHYVCYRIITNSVTRQVMVNNQFGSNAFPVTGPTELCLPSLKQVLTQPTGPGPNPTPTPTH